MTAPELANLLLAFARAHDVDTLVQVHLDNITDGQMLLDVAPLEVERMLEALAPRLDFH